MPRDRIYHALSIALLLTWGVAILVAAVAFSDGAPTWLAVAIVILAIVKTWIVYAHVHEPRKAEHARHEVASQERAEESLAIKAQRDRVVSVLDAVPEAVISTDPSGIVRFANAIARDIFESLESPGRSIEEVFTQREILALHAAALAGRPGQTQIRHMRFGNLQTAEVVACPLAEAGDPSPSGRPRFGVVIVLRDVTELALAVQLKTDFVANASHELRTPLSSIRLAAETITETMADAKGEEPAMASRLSGVILKNTVRLEDLVRDLLDLSRVESAEAPPAQERILLADMVANLEQLFAEVRATKRLTIEARIDPDANEFYSDPRLVELVLKNLIDNATKYAFDGTAVRVSASRVQPDNATQPVIRLKVADKGLGIPIGHQQRIFERFYQVDGARSGPTTRRGTGLGLAIVKHALKRLGGTIRVESVWQQGTTMIVDLTPAPRPEPV